MGDLFSAADEKIERWHIYIFAFCIHPYMFPGIGTVDGGSRHQKCLRTHTHVVQASSQTPVQLVQRRLITLLALAGSSFSFLPLDLLSG